MAEVIPSCLFWSAVISKTVLDSKHFAYPRCRFVVCLSAFYNIRFLYTSASPGIGLVHIALHVRCISGYLRGRKENWVRLEHLSDFPFPNCSALPILSYFTFLTQLFLTHFQPLIEKSVLVSMKKGIC